MRDDSDLICQLNNPGQFVSSVLLPGTRMSGIQSYLSQLRFTTIDINKRDNIMIKLYVVGYYVIGN